MNGFGQHSLNQAPDGVNPLAIVMSDIGDRRRKWALGTLLTTRIEPNLRGCQPYISHRLVVIGFIRLHMTPFRAIKAAGFAHPHITLRAWSQEALAWLPICGHQERHSAPIEITFLTRHTSPLCLMLVSLRPWTPVMVTDNHGKAVNDLDRFSMELPPGASSAINEPHETSRAPMEPTVHTTAAAQVWHLPRPAQAGTRRFDIAATEPHGHHARRDDFGIAHLRWRVFGLADRVQDSCTQAVDGQDLVVHGGASSFRSEGGRLHSPWRMSPMDVKRSQLGLT
jgi:hypothetical protein